MLIFMIKPHLMLSMPSLFIVYTVLKNIGKKTIVNITEVKMMAIVSPLMIQATVQPDNTTRQK